MLSSPNGDRVALKLAGYQFPGGTGDGYDDNWLFVDIQVTVDGEDWSVRDPCLLTWEANGLARWLDEIAQGNPTDPEFDFMEPALVFELVDRDARNTRLRVNLDPSPHQAPWLKRRGGTDTDFSIDVTVPHNVLAAVAKEIRENLALYPYRGPGPCPNYPMG